MAIDISKVSYSLSLITPDGGSINVDNMIMSGSLEELEGELASRLTVTMRNVKLEDGWLHQHAYLTRKVILTASDGINSREVFRGSIYRWKESSTHHEISFTAYDHLFPLQQSKEHWYFGSGETGASSIKKIAEKAGVPVGRIDGPNEKLAKKPYSNGSLGDIIADRLEESRKKGAGRFLVRSTQDKLEVVKEGSNKTIYVLDNRFIEDSSDEHDIESIVTRVKIYGNEDKEGRAELKTTKEKNTKFGVIQDIIYSSSYEDMVEAQKAADEILEEKSKPNIERYVSGPLIPWIRKGDLVEIKTGTICKVVNDEVIGVPCIVLGITYDILNLTMSLTLRG